MDYIVEMSTSGAYEMVMRQRLEGGIQLEIDRIVLRAKDYVAALVEAERNELLMGAPHSEFTDSLKEFSE